MTALGTLACLSLFGAGCSFFTIGHVPGGPAHCTTSYAAPFVDATAVATVAVLVTTSLDDECEGLGCAADAVTSPLTLVGALNAASAVYGGVVVRRCNNERAKLEHDLATMMASIVRVAEAGACEEVRRAVVVAEEVSADLGFKIALTNSAVLRCLVPLVAPQRPATSGT